MLPNMLIISAKTLSCDHPHPSTRSHSAIDRLVGCPPFWHRKQMVMLRNIMEGKYSFTSPEWADISEAPKDLIRKFLVVEPRDRISIDEALRHPFFNTVLWDQDMTPLKKSLSTTSRRMSRIDQLMQIKSSAFNPRAKLRLGLLAVRAAVRLRRLPHTAARTVVLHTAQIDPYTMRILRKVIDGCAFRVYGHWVKKGEGQNRAALFENTPKTELKSLYMTLDETQARAPAPAPTRWGVAAPRVAKS
ncbi:hypothetical protein EVAR_102726_1 [Eumeta japonica]|uniref:Protein kinase domain-containing protein n=1 Tax=Eumeta variegata TaxID=151549 RepID=A0A4C1THR3_EUMVA|nr:hypothetical protein EVAR_102726_1 [Eumeta japonica]